MKNSLEVLIKPLCAWYEANRKSFPWREDPTPYHVWISEIMLQQTRIEAALPYYARFLEAFPDVCALASADEEKVLKQWQGLGYYSRAKNLQKAAKLICEKYSGELPCTAKELRDLPGIGDYTAGAIASIAMGLPEPAVDGNVLRVVMRFTACYDDVMRTDVRKRVINELRDVYPSGKQAALFTEALMELGETVCLPNGTPKCEVCPLADFCAARAGKLTDILPVRSAQKPRKREEHTILFLVHDGRLALHKRTNGVLSDLWEPVNLDGKKTLCEIKALLSDCGVQVKADSIVDLGQTKHIFSHIEWHMNGYLIECVFMHEPDKLREDYTLVWENVHEIKQNKAIPSAFRAYLKKTGLF